MIVSSRIGGTSGPSGDVKKFVNDSPLFEIGDDEMEVGVGIRGEPGRDQRAVHHLPPRSPAARRKGITVGRSYVNEYCTSLDMAGASITLVRLDDEIEELLNAPAEVPICAFQEGPDPLIAGRSTGATTASRSVDLPALALAAGAMIAVRAHLMRSIAVSARAPLIDQRLRRPNDDHARAVRPFPASFTFPVMPVPPTGAAAHR